MLLLIKWSNISLYANYQITTNENVLDPEHTNFIHQQYHVN